MARFFALLVACSAVGWAIGCNDSTTPVNVAPGGDAGTSDTPTDEGPRTPVNVGGWVDSPHVSADGRDLYFMYAPLDILHFHATTEIRRSGPDRPGHTTSGDAPEALVNTDLYLARRREGGGWTVRALTALNTPDNHESCAFTSWDGKSLYFMRSPIIGKERPRYWVSKRNGDDFEAPVPVDLPVDNGNIALDEAETTLFFDTDFDNPNAGAGKELWVSTRPAGGAWSARSKLPAAVNDPKARSQTPWLSRDGKRIYFHRFFETGAGSQLLLTKRDDDFQSATALTIEGPPYVPTLEDRLVAEPSFTEDEKTMFALVYNVDGIPELWFGNETKGTWTLRSVDAD